MKFMSLKYKLLNSIKLDRSKVIILIYMFLFYISFAVYFHNEIGSGDYRFILSGLTKTNRSLIGISLSLVSNATMACLSLNLIVKYKKIIYDLILRDKLKKIYTHIYLENCLLLVLYTLFFVFACNIIFENIVFDSWYIVLLLLKNIYIGSVTFVLYELFENKSILIICLLFVLSFFVDYFSMIYIMDSYNSSDGVLLLLFVNLLLYWVGYLNRRCLYEYKN